MSEQEIAANRSCSGDRNKALAAAMEHCTNREEGHKNLIIAGPCGTGKDHLLFCVLAKFIFHANADVQHYRGCNLTAELIAGARDGKNEQIIARCIDANILSISDPIPPSGEFSDFIRRSMLRIIDNRYADMKPTYLTVNLKDSKQMREKIGDEMTDRILEKGRAIRCFWESYRTPPVDAT
jgi:DNA replication protein DnaC